MFKRNLLLIAKCAPGLAVAYCLCPVDVIPDFFPVVGQLDDLAVTFCLLAAALVATLLLVALAKHEQMHAAILFAGMALLSVRMAPAAEQTPEVILSPLSQPVPMFKLSLASAFQRAADHNKQLLATEENRAIARANVTIARAYPNPQFALQYGFGTPYTKIIAGNTQQVGINQTIENPAKTMSRIRTAQAESALAEAQYVAARFALRIQVRRAYAELAASEANIELVENQRELTEKLYSMAKKKVEAGSSPGAELVQAELSLMQFDTQRVQAQSRLKQASSQMDLLIGEKPDRVIDVEDNGIFRLSAERTSIVPEVSEAIWPLPKVKEMAYKNRPDFKVAIEQLETNRRGLTSARAQQVPDLMLGAGYVFSTYLKDQNVPVQRGIYLNANMDMPVFYHHQGEVALAKASYRQAAKQLDATKAQIETDVQTAYQAFVAARENIVKYQAEILPKANQMVRLARRSYETGFQPISTVILAQQQYQQTRSSYFDTVVAYQNAWADLENAVGQPLELP